MVIPKQIWANKETGEFIEVKEITFLSNFICSSKLKQPYCIVTGGDSNFSNDARTNIDRKVYDFKTFKEKYVLLNGEFEVEE